MKQTGAGRISHLNKRVNNQEAAGEQSLPLVPSLYAVFLCLLFGANAVALKICLAGIGVYTAASIRFIIASFTIFFWARLSGKSLQVTRDQFPAILLLSGIFFVQLSLFYFGQQKTSATHGTILANALPFGVMILAHFFIPEDRISGRKVAGLLLGFSGVMLLLTDISSVASGNFSGDLLILGAVMLWSINGVFTKKIIHQFTPQAITLYPMTLAGFGFLVCGFIFDDVMVEYIDKEIVCSLFYLTFITASFGMVAWNTLIRKYGATNVHSFVFIMPISGVLLGVFYLGEEVSIRLVMSILCVVAGLLIVNSRKKTTPPAGLV